MRYIDSHTHLQFPQYDKDRSEAFQRSFENDVGLINVGTNRKTSREAVDLVEKHKDSHVYATIGTHPTEADEGFDYEYYKNLSRHDGVVALGECGLDYFRTSSSNKKIIKKQHDVFSDHIKLAKETGLPLMIHCRPSPDSQDAYEDLYNMLVKENNNLKGVIIHFFVGNKEIAEKFLDLGFYFTFGGVITFVRDYDEVIRTIPINRILLETDAPYVTPEPHRGNRNEPLFVREVYKKMAEIKNISLDEIIHKVKNNNETIFNL